MSKAMRVASPRWARVDAAAPTPWLTLVDGSVAARGREVLVLEGAAGDVVISSGRFGLAPGGIQLTEDDFATLRTVDADLLSIAHWNPSVTVEARLAVRRTVVHAEALSILAGAAEDETQDAALGVVAAAPLRAWAPELAALAVQGDDPAPLLQRLVGAGPGSTPTGDDIIVGVLAGLSAAAPGFAAPAIAARIQPLLTRTTRVSAHYLAAATTGRFADRVHTLVAALASPARARVARVDARGWGATSGLDLISGIVAGARAGRLGRTLA